MDSAIPPKAAPLVGELLAVTGQLQLILLHMEHYGAAADGDRLAAAASAPGVLAELLGTVLAPLERSRPEDCATAASVVAQVADAIESELFLVPAEPPGPPGPLH